MSLLQFDVGIDLGTTKITIALPNHGIVFREPSLIAEDTDTGKAIAFGSQAEQMWQKTPRRIGVVNPIRSGVIADDGAVEKLLRYAVQKTIPRSLFFKPRMAIGVPADSTEIEKRALHRITESIGVAGLFLIEQSIAAAMGLNMPIHEPAGSMICDTGGGTTEISILSLGGIVQNRVLRLGGRDFDQAIIKHMREEHNLEIGERTAEQLKIATANEAAPRKDGNKIGVKGIDRLTGLPCQAEIRRAEIPELLMRQFLAVAEAIRKTLQRTSPELVADIVERGIVVTGGGSLLKCLCKTIREEIGIPVITFDDPFGCVAKGLLKILTLSDGSRPSSAARCRSSISLRTLTSSS